MKTKAHILLVEDDEPISDVVVYILEKYSFSVKTAADGKAGLAAFRRHPPDLVVLDLNLPHLSGKELFIMMRRERPQIPVIMLTCQSDEVDRIVGLEMGADDYVTKPFNTRELAARVTAVLRRCRTGQQSPRTVVREGPVEIDLTARTVHYFSQRIDLTRQEFELMHALTASPARTYSRDELLYRMYGENHFVTDRSVDACIKRLRRKLHQIHPERDPIRTLYGIGYKFNEQLGE
jgi:DNA-binding response OmpR family regulator